MGLNEIPNAVAADDGEDLYERYFPDPNAAIDANSRGNEEHVASTVESGGDTVVAGPMRRVVALAKVIKSVFGRSAS